MAYGMVNTPGVTMPELETVKTELESKFTLSNIAPDGAGAHNSFYRGKALGQTVTEEQYAAIGAGTFKDLFIGDYWTIGGINWRIAAFDYYLNIGKSNDDICTTHHAVIVPDTSLYTAKMNDSNSTEGGYAGSKMCTENLDNAKTTIHTLFEGHILNHPTVLVNGVTNGYSSNWNWYDSKIELMSERMVYGGSFLESIENESHSYMHKSRMTTSQLPLFFLAPGHIRTGEWYWLRDVVTDSHFTCVSYMGFEGSGTAGTLRGVRPVFCIC